MPRGSESRSKSSGNRSTRKVSSKVKLAKPPKRKSVMAQSGEGAPSVSRKRPIEQYDHKDKKRVNNPPVGLVTEATDRETGKKTYRNDPHIDPALQFHSQRSQIEKIIDDDLATDDLKRAKAVLN